MKYIIIGLIILIAGSLFAALVYLYKSRGTDDRMVKALTLRIALSIFVVLLLVTSYYLKIIPATGFK